MSKPARLFVVALLFFAAACVWYAQSPAAAQDKEKTKERALDADTKWEYRVVTMLDGAEEDGQKELNKLGNAGFELVSATSSLVGGGQRTRIHYTLKRVKK